MTRQAPTTGRLLLRRREVLQVPQRSLSCGTSADQPAEEEVGNEITRSCSVVALSQPCQNSRYRMGRHRLRHVAAR
jgi:hypothetical protein